MSSSDENIIFKSIYKITILGRNMDMSVKNIGLEAHLIDYKKYYMYLPNLMKQKLVECTK